jgi:hypothetical protein
VVQIVEHDWFRSQGQQIFTITDPGSPDANEKDSTHGEAVRHVPQALGTPEFHISKLSNCEQIPEMGGLYCRFALQSPVEVVEFHGGNPEYRVASFLLIDVRENHACYWPMEPFR